MQLLYIIRIALANRNAGIYESVVYFKGSVHNGVRFGFHNQIQCEGRC